MGKQTYIEPIKNYKSVATVMLLIGILMAGNALALPVDDGNFVSDDGTIVTHNVQSDSSSTSKWTGLLGNISSSEVSLGNGINNMYLWSFLNPLAVYVSSSNSVAWTNVSGITDTSSVDAALGFDNSSSDSIENTMTETGCSTGTIITGAKGVTTLTNTGSDSAWTTCIATDGSVGVDQYVYGTDITTGDTDFLGGTSEYQMMIPSLNGGTYYVYVEL